MEERVKQLEKENLELKANVEFLSDSLNKALAITLTMLTKVEEISKSVRDLQHTVYKTPW